MGICPAFLPTCQDPAIKAQYSFGGKWGTWLDAVRMKVAIQLTGYEEEGCKLPFEYPRHGKICPKGMSLGLARKTFGVEMNKKRDPPQVDVDKEEDGLNGKVGKPGPSYSYEKHKEDVAATTCSVFAGKYNTANSACTDNYDDWVKATTSNFYQWFDETPYDNSDNLALDTTFKMDDTTKPCKWDGSTNNVAGCPHMEHEQNFFIGHGIFNPDRMSKDNPNLPLFGVTEKRNMELKFQGNNLVHGIKGKKYTIDEKHYLGSHENAKYGMPASGASYENFPGSGMMPMAKVMGGPPMFASRPHWLGGGAEAERWNRELGTRQPTATSDEWSVTLEPLTGLPVTGSLQWQMNAMYKPNPMKIHTGDLNSPVLYDFSNLTLTAGPFAGETVNLASIGKYRNCANPVATHGDVRSWCHSG